MLKKMSLGDLLVKKAGDSKAARSSDESKTTKW